MNDHVLILNRSWLAVHIASARRALAMLYLDVARVVHPLDFSLHDFSQWVALSQDGLGGRYIFTPSFRIRIPEVVLLRSFNGYIRREIRLSRHSIFERDQYTCQYCGKQLPKSRLTLDHILPQSRGGKNNWENLVVACMDCNARKADRTPAEAKMTLLRKPSRPGWLPRPGQTLPVEKLQVWQHFIDVSYWGPAFHPESGQSFVDA